MRNTSHYADSSELLDQLFKAHAKALAEIKNAPKNAISNFAKKGPDGKPIPNYADLASILDTVRPVLGKHGLSVTQSFAPYNEDGRMMLVTTLGHGESGQFMRSYLPFNGNLPPQQLTATITYLKRSALSSIVGIAAEEDDDGTVAEQAAAPKDAPKVSDKRIAAALRKNIESAKTPEARAAELDRARKGLELGHLTPETVDSLCDLVEAINEREAAEAK